MSTTFPLRPRAALGRGMPCPVPDVTIVPGAC